MADETTPALTGATLDELRALEAKATPGPWHIHTPQSNTHIIDDGGGYILEGARQQSAGGVRGFPADAELIVAMRNAIPGLLAEVSRLSSEAASLRAALTEAMQRIKLLDTVIAEHHAASIMREEFDVCPVCIERGAACFFAETAGVVRRCEQALGAGVVPTPRRDA